MVVEESLVVEVDGWEFHRGREAFEHDRGRDRTLLVGGMPSMRFTARELRGDLVGMARQVAQVVNKVPRRDTERRLAWAAGHGV